MTFRVLQHGVRPIDATLWPDLDSRLEVTGLAGTESVAVLPAGTPGRFVAAVTVPEAPSVELAAVLLATGVVCLGVLVIDVVAGRRRRRSVAAPVAA